MTRMINLAGQSGDLITWLRKYVPKNEVRDNLIHNIIEATGNHEKHFNISLNVDDMMNLQVQYNVEPPVVEPMASSQNQDWCGQSQPHPPHVWAKGHLGWLTNCSGHS